MLNKFRRFIRKFPGLSFLLAAGLIASTMSVLYTDEAGKIMLQVTAVVALIIVTSSARHSLRQGLYGIHILPVIAILTALIQNQLWTAYVLAIVVAIEKPLICFLQRGRVPQSAKASSLTNAQHTPLARKLDLFSVPYIVLIFLLAGAVWVVSDAPDRFLKVLSAASTAPLLLAVPAAYITGVKRAGKRGVIFTSASSFEKLGNTKSLFLYKSGILTAPNVTIATVTPFNKRKKSEVIQIAASLASQSQHPLSRAITAFAGGQLKVTKAKHAKEKPNGGISGRIRGHDLHIGRRSYLIEKGVAFPSNFTEPEETAVYVAEDEVLVGVLTFRETYRDGAVSLGGKLKKAGLVSVVLLSHGSEKALSTTAHKVHIQEFIGDIHPGEAVSRLQSAINRPVGLVADAHTDSAALTAADVAITPDSIQPGITDVALLDYRPSQIAQACVYAKRFLRTANISSLLGMWLVIVLLVIATSGKVAALYLAIGQLVITLLSLLAPVFTQVKD